MSPRMPQKSPPKHRHDGNSPLPLGMDWSPPPKRWEGRDTVWPHDSRSGWSYCVTVPSWIVQAETKASEGSFIDPVVFYRVQVGIQSPEGISLAGGVFRRFSDFLKLYSALKRVFPKKILPPHPPKHRFLRINSSKALLEERRCALEEWMGKLLCDIDLSRSVPMASFLELEAAARASFQDENHKSLDAVSDGIRGGSSSWALQATSSASFVVNNSLAIAKTSSISTDNCSDYTYEASDLGTPRHGRDQFSEIGSDDISLDQDLTSTMGTITKYGRLNNENGLMGETMSEQLEFPRDKMLHRKENSIRGKDVFYGNASTESQSELKGDNILGHARKLSAESLGSDTSSARGSEMLNSGLGISGDNSVGAIRDAEVAGLQFSNNVQIVLPLDQRNKMNRVFTTFQRRLATATTDMEDLRARLDQETATKEYLTTKVKDLEIELESTKQKAKENLQQTILIERERITQMQWDLEELRRKSMEMESKLKFEQDEKIIAESEKMSAISEKTSLMQELNAMREQFEKLQRHQAGSEMKSKGDIKVLVKEVKSLRKTQTELRQELSQSLQEKSELQKILQKEKQKKEQAKLAREKLLHECEILRSRLQECSVNFLAEGEDKFNVETSLSDALDLLTTSDNRIGLLLAEAQLLAQDDDDQGDKLESNTHRNGDDPRIADNEVRKMLTDIFIDNAQLRKQVNSVMGCALKTIVKPDKEDGRDDTAPARKTVLNKFLER
ncbi:PX domain-containing protein EREL1-like [Aristolochia californica]|uniref:PX domain-containing protein EREL1-like n=1 Tax=Aristolochia californica TaxID=171875 RepID=UPI0035DE90B8